MTKSAPELSDTEEEADVIVVGGGGAGLAAAITACEIGRSVILIEKNPQIGGSTIWAVGTYTATATPHQIRRGIKDSPDLHFADLDLVNARVVDCGPEDNLGLRRLLVDNSTDTLQWLMRMGLVFYGPTPEPPHRHPRMVSVLPNAGAFGYFLERRARRMGVDIRCRHTLQSLVHDGTAVTGVECVTADGRTLRLRARGGVVLATGDFSGSAELKRRFGALEAAEVQATNPAMTGDGHRLALDIGAQVINGHLLLALVRFVAPPRTWIHSLPPWPVLTKFMRWSLEHMPLRLLKPLIMSFLTTIIGVYPNVFRSGAILVNKQGERFCDETKDPVFPLSRQPEQTAYIILDGVLGELFSTFPNFISTAPGVGYAYLPDYLRSRPDVARKADSVAALARAIGAEPHILEETVAARKAEVSDGTKAYVHGPWYALGPMRCYVNFTEGGLAISERMEVLREDGLAIPGLYAAGSVGQGGMLLEGHGHHLSWAFVSGRFAGRNAAFRVTSPAA